MYCLQQAERERARKKRESIEVLRSKSIRVLKLAPEFLAGLLTVVFIFGMVLILG